MLAVSQNLRCCWKYKSGCDRADSEGQERLGLRAKAEHGCAGQGGQWPALKGGLELPGGLVECRKGIPYCSSEGMSQNSKPGLFGPVSSAPLGRTSSSPACALVKGGAQAGWCGRFPPKAEMARGTR